VVIHSTVAATIYYQHLSDVLSRTIPHFQADQAVRNLHVFCAKKKKGCEWQDEVNGFINHLGSSSRCVLEEVTCSNGCRKCLTIHVVFTATLQENINLLRIIIRNSVLKFMP